MAEMAPDDTFLFPLSSKKSSREITKLLNLKEWRKLIQTVDKCTMTILEAMDAKTNSVTTALVGLKLKPERDTTENMEFTEES